MVRLAQGLISLDKELLTKLTVFLELRILFKWRCGRTERHGSKAISRHFQPV